MPPHSPATDLLCDLCGLPAGRDPLSRSFDNVAKFFCCAGCLNVYAILSESGALASGADFRESEVYRQSLKLGLISNARRDLPPVPDDAETRETVYHLGGLWCGSCGWLIEHALGRQRGVVSAEVLFTSDLLKVKYCPQFIDPERIPAHVASLGYRAEEYGASHQGAASSERYDLLLRLGVAGFLWMNVMLFSLVIYASYFEGISEWARRYIPLILMALATPAVFYSAWPIHRLAVLGLWQGNIRMEALISSGVLAAYGYSVVQAVSGSKYLYFDTACAIVTLVLAGKALERGAKERTAQAVATLYRMMPKKARLASLDKERFVSIEAVEPGMVLLVKPGERIPADGMIIDGAAPVDESLITGESAPRPKIVGDHVLGGSLNSTGVLTISATHNAAQSTLAQIIASVERALASRTPLERAVDRVSRIFVPVVMAVSASTLIGWTMSGMDFTEALMRSIAVLVIACPCALGIATPLATTAAIGAASRRGILIRDARVLETIGKVDVIVLDKTGTVTEGVFGVQQTAWSASASEAARQAGFAALVTLEARSEHPLAEAITRYGAERGVCPLEASQVEIIRGQGIRGSVNGRSVVAGNRSMLKVCEAVPDPALDEQAREWESQGLTTVFLAVDGAVAGVFGLGDRLRPDAAAVIHAWRQRGIRVVLLSGDSTAATARIAKLLGADEFRGEVRPEEKAAAVRSFQQGGAVVAMAGDGINDAPALAAADLGVAMGSGTDLAMQAAPVVLMGGELFRLLETYDLARFTLRVVRQNLFWAFFYNAAGISLSIAGILNPILAAGAMVFLESVGDRQFASPPFWRWDGCPTINCGCR